MKLFNRDSIASDIRVKVFSGKTVWDMIFDSAKESIAFVISSNYSNRRLYEKMVNNVRSKAGHLGGQLKHIYVVINGRRKFLTYKNAEEMMQDVIRNQIPVTFKIMVRNKYYEFTVGH